MAAETTLNNKRQYKVGAVEKAMLLLNLLLDAQEGMTLTELSVAAGVSKNIIFRLLMTLERRGVLERDRHNRYCIGISTFVAARKVVSREGATLRRILEEVAGRLDEAVYFARKVDGDSVLVEMADCRQKVRVRSFIGAVMREEAADSRELVAGISIVTGGLDPEITTVSIDLTVGVASGSLVVVAPSYRMYRERTRKEAIAVLQETVQRMPKVARVARNQQPPVVLQLVPAQIDSRGGSNENSCLH